MLGLEWSAFGPGDALEQFCANGDKDGESPVLDLPSIPSIARGKLMFSYSGLHSIIERFIASRGGIDNLDTRTKRAVARSFQTAAVTQLEEKLALGLDWCERRQIQIRHVIVSGGVASNSFLRAR